LGEIYKLRNQFETALEFYKKSIDFEIKFPNVITQSFLSYSELIVRLKKNEKYDNVLNILNPRINESIFPIEKYKMGSILSIIYASMNKSDLAKKYEIFAQENANAETSGLQYHKYLGVVKERTRWLDKLLKRK
nr:hypothetical protein [Candidatus Kapabacteria bacterium]